MSSAAIAAEIPEANRTDSRVATRLARLKGSRSNTRVTLTPACYEEVDR